MRNILLFLLFFLPMSAYAYIGPGMGAGTIGVIIGILMSIFLALFAILWYPFKRLLKKKRKPDTDDSKVDSKPS
jgi:preprotein translocase subunit SecF